MNRGLFSAISALTLATGTAAYYFWKNLNSSSPNLLPRLLIRDALVSLRKRAYSTLREIAFIVSSIRALEGDLEVKKINEIFMRDGGSGEKKLNAIEALVLKQEDIEQKDFEHSCTYYSRHDLQIKMLLQTFKKDLNMALEGVIETYHGPLPHFAPQKVLKMQEQVIKRRMGIIEGKQIWGRSDEECLREEAHIEEYLAQQGVKHEKESNQKIFMSMLEHHYRSDAEFKEHFEQLQMEMEMFMIEIENRCKQRKEEEEREDKGEEREEERIEEVISDVTYKKQPKRQEVVEERWPEKMEEGYRQESHEDVIKMEIDFDCKENI